MFFLNILVFVHCFQGSGGDAVGGYTGHFHPSYVSPADEDMWCKHTLGYCSIASNSMDSFSWVFGRYNLPIYFWTSINDDTLWTSALNHCQKEFFSAFPWQHKPLVSLQQQDIDCCHPNNWVKFGHVDKVHEKPLWKYQQCHARWGHPWLLWTWAEHQLQLQHHLRLKAVGFL